MNSDHQRVVHRFPVLKVLKKYPEIFQRKMVQNVLLVVLLFVLFLVGYESYSYRVVERKVTQERIEHVQEQSANSFQTVLQILFENNLERIQQWGERGEFSFSNHDSIASQPLFLLSKIPFRTSLQIADDAGTEFLLYEDREAWRKRIVRQGESTLWTRWEGGEIFQDEEEFLEYDPRVQPWYTAAVEHEQTQMTSIAWTIPSLVPVSQKQGITGSITWSTPETTYVAALTIRLEDVLSFMTMLSRSEPGSVFLLTQQGEIIQTPDIMASIGVEPSHDESLESLDLNFSAATVAIDEFAEFRKTHEFSPGDFFRSTTVKNPSWLIGIKEFSFLSHTLWLGAAVPENTLQPHIQKQRGTLLWFLISTVTFAVALVVILARTFLMTYWELKALRDEPDEEHALLERIQQGENKQLEFKSTLRWNLKTNKPGKEIELAWLKTVVAYLNSDGGSILIGVKDDGSITGIVADNFKSDDKLLLHVQNLIKQHVGLEFSQFITTTLHSIAGQQVLMVTCTSAKVPVFLKHNNDEQFFIRTGPSSIKLSGSAMLSYLEHRSLK